MDTATLTPTAKSAARQTPAPTASPARKVRQDRPYQARIRQKALDGWIIKRANSQLIVSPTGSGKTVMGLSCCQDIVDNREAIFGPGTAVEDIIFIWVAMRAKLLVQASEENGMVGVENIRYVSMFDTDPARHSAGVKHVVCVFDEAHHAAAATCVELYNQVKPALVIGLSATPVRTDKMDLCFQLTITDAGYHRLIQEGWLSPFDHYSIGGAWSPENVAAHYLADPAKWGQSVMFFLTQAECDACCALLNEGGVRATVVTGKTDAEAQVEAFEAGELDVLLNMVMLTEGFDCPQIKTVWVRDSANKGPITQMCGRVLRLYRDLPVKQIVQSLETHYPFLRVAAARTQIVEVEGTWRTIGMNDKVERMQAVMMNRMAMQIHNIGVPAFLRLNARGTRWDAKEETLVYTKDDGAEALAQTHATLFANMHLLNTTQRPQSDVEGVEGGSSKIAQKTTKAK